MNKLDINFEDRKKKKGKKEFRKNNAKNEKQR